MEKLTNRIKNLRQEKGWTQKELAMKLGVTDKTVSKWEVGKANPDLELVPRIAQLFDVSTDFLLTAEETKEKIIVMSKVEFACKNDDFKLLDFQKNNFESLMRSDDEGHNLYYYVDKYSSKKLFKELIKNIDLRLVFPLRNEPIYSEYRSFRSPKLFSLLVKFNMINDLEYARMLWPIRKEKYGKNYDQMSVFYEDNINIVLESKNNKLLEKIMSLHTSKANGVHFNYFEPYLTIVNACLRKEYVDQAKIILTKIIELDEKCYEEYQKHKSEIDYNYCNLSNGKNLPNDAYADENGVFKSFNARSTTIYIFTFDKEHILKMLELDLVQEARYFNDLNKHISINEIIEENQFLKFEAIKNNSKFDLRIFDVMSSDILIYDRLLKIKDEKFIVKMLKDYPVCYAEFLYSLLLKKNFRKLFEFFVDYSLYDYANKMLKGNEDSIAYTYQAINILLAIMSNYTYGWRMQEFMTQFEKISNIDKLNKRKISNRNYQPVFINDFRDSEEYILCVKDKIAKSINFIEEQKLEVSSKYTAIIQTKDLISKNYTKKYFISEIEQNHMEDVIIKLCTLFELKLKGNGFTGDFSVMLKSYCQKFYEEDDWREEIICNNPQLVNSLQTLRMMRNNILHPNSKEINKLTKEELLSCINHICELEV